MHTPHVTANSQEQIDEPLPTAKQTNIEQNTCLPILFFLGNFDTTKQYQIVSNASLKKKKKKERDDVKQHGSEQQRKQSLRDNNKSAYIKRKLV